MENEDKEMKDFAIKACQMGIMGVNSDGTSNTTFDPNGIVTRAQFGTMLSRVLYGNKYNSTDSKYRYKAHLNALNGNGIMKDISKPAMLEQRGFVLLMLMRTATK
jgi:Flp pilus assembly secretin CpaC